jgi:chromosome segregation protein
MRIKEIELDNFKSFGETTGIALESGFTTVTGPNGSGKSNVVDSLMFALGLASTRNMRAERLTDLLNNLTGRQECGVKVIFINDETKEEIEVQRKIRIKKDSSYDSKYYLNGEHSTLTEIHERLAKHNISPRGFNVVMQGDVASIISMNTVDRRKIIDEIAGVADFDRKIELADKELSIVLERIESQELILVELKNRLEQLAGDREKAIKYAELKKKLIELEKQFLAVRIKQLKTEETNTETELENLKTLKINLQVESNTINEDMAGFQAELNRLSLEIEELGEGRQRQLGALREEKKELLAREESALGYLNKQIEDQLAQQEKWQKEIKNGKKILKDIDFKSAEFTEELKSIKQNITEEESRYGELQEKIRKKSESSNLSTQTVINTQEKVAKLKEDKAQIEQEKARLEEKKSALEENLDKHRKEAERVSLRLSELKLKSGANLDMDALKEQLNFQVKTLNSLKDEQKETQTEITNQQSKLRRIETDLSKMEGEEQAANAAGFGHAVETVLGIDGVRGTLAQLGTVESEYQLAVETAAGARLRAVVVDDDYVAQECISFLREKNAGRATFLPLNKLREAREQALPNDKGVVDWAINLVSFDSEYNPAFAYAFADTLVVKNIEVARRMIGRYRMVTPQGDLIERSGAMTGGAAIKSNIHFGADSGKQKFRLIEQKEEAEKFIKQLQEEYLSLEKQIEEIRHKIDDFKTRLSKKEAETGVSGAQIESLEEIYAKEKEELGKNSVAIQDLEEKIESLNAKVFKQERQIQEEEQGLQGLAAEMKDSGLEALIKESQEIEVEIKRYTTMMNNLISESKGLEVERNFNNQSLDKLEAQIQESEKETAELRETVPRHQERISSVNSEINNINEEIARIRESLGNMQNERNQLSEKLLALGQRKGFVISQIESTAIKIVENKKKLTSVQEHLGQLLEEMKEHPELSEIDLPEEDLSKLQAELNRLEKQMRSMEPINMRAVEEYEEVSKRQEEIIEKQKSLAEERQMLIDKILSYRTDKKESFLKNFNEVNSYFQEIFADLSFGQGQLILEDPDEIFNGGLIIKAQPRGKKMQRLEAMSGGEKSLTALSFLFALQQCTPAPFYAFDEVDSALDGVNVDRLAHKIRRNSMSTQFIVVSHRRPMIEQSDRAIGVSVNKHGFSKVIGVHNIEHTEELLAV